MNWGIGALGGGEMSEKRGVRLQVSGVSNYLLSTINYSLALIQPFALYYPSSSNSLNKAVNT